MSKIKKLNLKKGFTLIEILLVIVLISILLIIVLFNVNTEARFIESRNDTRKTNIQVLEGAVTQYRLQTGSYPTGLSRTYQEICDPDASSCAGYFDLKTFLVPKYLQAIPQDPNDADTTGGAGYEIAVDVASNTVGVRLKESLREGGVVIAINDPLPNAETTTTNAALVATNPQSPPSTGPLATGGTITSFVGNGTNGINGKLYYVHTFTTSGTFTANTSISNVEYLVVAGGGGGYKNGGGGAGGYRSSVQGESSGGGASAESPFTVSAGTNYTVVVGAGGSGSNSNLTSRNGGSSSFAGITATGGGGGPVWGPGNPGGSGSGGASSAPNVTNSGGPGTTNQGYAGGNAISDNHGAGGGGASQKGFDSREPVTKPGGGGNGGAGLASSITGTSVTRAGGGGGAAYITGTDPTATIGLGGSGGGGNGGLGGVGSNASANTGSGGGGGASGLDGGNGGSGIVIIRY